MTQCNIQRVRNLKQINYTFRQPHFSGLIQHGLDYISCLKTSSKWLKDSRYHINISGALFKIIISCTKHCGLWKFNNSLVSKERYIQKINNTTNKQVWLDTQQHQNRKDHFGPICFGGFSSTRCYIFSQAEILCNINEI